MDTRKRDEIIERSKCVFGDNAFDYSKIPLDVNMVSTITLICKKCGDERRISLNQHLGKYYGCKKCKNTYYNENDTIEQREKKLRDIEIGIAKIKEKYHKKTYQQEVIKKYSCNEDEIVEDAKVLILSNTDIVIDDVYISKLFKFLNSNGFKLIKV